MIDEEIQEVRAIRHAISQECDHDVRKLAAYLKSVETKVRLREATDKQLAPRCEGDLP